MTDPESPEMVIALSSDARTAAERLSRALHENADAGFVTPRIAGEVDYPHVSVWRSRGRGAPSPFARFEGAFQQIDGRSELVGNIAVPASRWIVAMRIVVPSFMISALVLFLSVSTTRKLAGITAGAGFAAIGLGFVYLARRVARANVRAESELLAQELKELVERDVNSDG